MEPSATIEAAPPKRLVSEVFGISRNLPLSYLPRPRIDQDFLSFIAQGRHVVVYGGSSQGKSSLIRKHFSRDAIIEVQCGPEMKRFDLYRLLLREAGVYVSLGRKKKRMKGVSAEVTLYREDSGTESEVAEQTISIDLANINDIIRLLAENGVGKTIVLDDFHLLPGKTKRQVAADLRIVYDRSALQFIVIGAWRHEDKLTMLSGYLPARSHSINVDAWTASELEDVVTRGTVALNLRFTLQLTQRLVELSCGNVGILQQLCQHVCQLAGIDGTDTVERTLADPDLADTALRTLVEANAGRYRLFIERYGEEEGGKDLERWIMHAVISLGPDALNQGISASAILDHVNIHHRGIEEIYNRQTRTYRRLPYRGRIGSGGIIKRLKRLEEYQRDTDLNPIALSYDKRRDILRAVDVGLLLFLRTSDPQELLTRLLPSEDDASEDDILRAARGEFDESETAREARRQAAIQSVLDEVAGATAASAVSVAPMSAAPSETPSETPVPAAPTRARRPNPARARAAAAPRARAGAAKRR